MSKLPPPLPPSRLSAGESQAATPDSPAPLFLYNRWAARYWFNSKIKPSVEVRDRYTFAGWLLGQALSNRTSLGIPFPELLFSKLLQGPSFKAGSLSSCPPPPPHPLSNVDGFVATTVVLRSLQQNQGGPLPQALLVFSRCLRFSHRKINCSRCLHAGPRS